MNCKQEDGNDALIFHNIQINDSYIPRKHQPPPPPEPPKPPEPPEPPEPPRLSIRLPQEINQKASKIHNPEIFPLQARRRSISSSPEIQYVDTVTNPKASHSKHSKNRFQTQRQDSFSLHRTDLEPNFQGFQTRYSKRKLVKSSLQNTSSGMVNFLSINREIILSAWERKLKSNKISGNTNTEKNPDGSYSPFGSASPASEFNERLNSVQNSSMSREYIYNSAQNNSSLPNSSPSGSIGNGRSRNPSHNSSVGMRSPTVFSPLEDYRTSYPPQYSSRSLNSPLEDLSVRYKSQDHIRVNNSMSPLRNPDPPQSLNSPISESRLPMRNPDPPQSLFRQLSPPNNSRSDMRSPEHPRCKFKPSYENRILLTNPDPPQLNLQSSFEKSPFWEVPNSSNFNNNVSMIHTNHIEESMRRIGSIDDCDAGTDKQYSAQQPIHIHSHRRTENHVEQGNPEESEINHTIDKDLENNELDETIDIDIARRCTVYMNSFKCLKGDYCEKIHRFPKEDRVICNYFKNEGCRRPASDCWFWHPGEIVEKVLPDENAPHLVQPMGELLGYIRKEVEKNPDKYKRTIEPNVAIPSAVGDANHTPLGSNKIEIPSAVGNANHTPLGPRQIGKLESNHSPLLPHLKKTNSTNIVDNINIHDCTPSISDITLPSRKRSIPVKVGAPRKKCVESTNDNGNDKIVSDTASIVKTKSFKIPKKSSVNTKNSAIMNENRENTEILDIAKELNSQTNIEKNEKKEKSKITSKHTADEDLTKTDVNDGKNIESDRSSKEHQSNKKYEEKKAKLSKKSKEVNSKMKRKARPISESEEDENIVENPTKVMKKLSSNSLSNERGEKIQEKISKKPTNKENKMKRSKIVSNDKSEEKTSQSVVTNSKKCNSSSDENEEEKDESEDIQTKRLNKYNKKTNKFKKSTLELEGKSEEENLQSVVSKNEKLKNGGKSEEDIRLKKSKNHTKKEKKRKVSRIESSNESEEDAPQSMVGKNKQSKLKKNVDEQFSEKIKDEPKETTIKVEKYKKEEGKNKIILEITLSDSDDGCDVIKSEAILNEESFEVDTDREGKAKDDLFWAIDKALKLIEVSTDGAWKRTPCRIEEDLLEVIQGYQLDLFEDSSYPDIYNLDINYRQLYIKISGVDEKLREHALLCKERYPNCKNIPENHHENMSCCK